MKFCITLLLVASLGDAQAGIQGASFSEEDGPRGSYRSDLPRDFGERNAVFDQDDEDAPSAIVNSSEAEGSQGGGIALIDPKLLKPNDPAPSWWQGIWNWMTGITS